MAQANYRNLLPQLQMISLSACLLPHGDPIAIDTWASGKESRLFRNGSDTWSFLVRLGEREIVWRPEAKKLPHSPWRKDAFSR